MNLNRLTILPLLLALSLVAGCAGKPGGRGDGFYGGDRPPQRLPVDPDAVADAVPRHEPLSAGGNKPYTALGKRYRPLASARGYVKRGMASWYGKKFHGRRTSSGERYDMFAMTAAHPTLPLPTYVRVTSLDNGKSVVVRVNDRGPFLHNRIIDLSYVAAHKLDIARRGTGRVEVRAIGPGDGGAVVANTASTAADTKAAGGAVVGYAGGASPASSKSSQAAVGDSIFVQVGAYFERNNALNMQQRLQRAGYRVARARDHWSGGRPVYRVRVGPFASRHQAWATQQKLESMLGHLVAVVVD